MTSLSDKDTSQTMQDSSPGAEKPPDSVESSTAAAPGLLDGHPVLSQAASILPVGLFGLPLISVSAKKITAKTALAFVGMPAITLMMLVLGIAAGLRFILGMKAKASAEADSVSVSAETVRWWRQHWASAFAALGVSLVVVWFNPIEGITLLFLGSMAFLIVFLGRLSQLGLLQREHVSGLCSQLLLHLGVFVYAFIPGLVAWLTGDTSYVMGGMAGPMAWSLAVLFLGGIFCTFLGQSWRQHLGSVVSFFRSYTRGESLVLWIALLPVLALMVGALGFLLWVFASLVTNTFSPGYSSRMLQRAVDKCDEDTFHSFVFATNCANWAKETGVSLDPTPLRSKALKLLEGAPSVPGDVSHAVLSLDLIPAKQFAKLPGVAEHVEHARRDFLEKNQRWNKILFPVTNGEFLVMALSSERTPAERLALAERLMAVRPGIIEFDGISQSLRLHWVMKGLGHEKMLLASAAEFREMIWQLYLPKQGGFFKGGGFPDEIQEEGSRYFDSGTTLDAVWLMSIVGVPEKLDLRQLRDRLSRSNRGFLSLAGKSPSEKDLRLALTILDERLELTPLPLLEWIQKNGLFLGALLLAIFCLVVTARAPRGAPQGV